jgi:DNA-binding transcriptional LysR family regulator
MDGVDLNDVVAFVRVAEGSGLTPAARALGVPKSTVSRALARLERHLGVRLVQRTTRALALTEAGRAYYDRVRGAVAGVLDATSDVVDMGQEPRGTIRVTSPADLGEALLAEAVARFSETYREVQFEVVITTRVVDIVAEGFDLALRVAPMGDSSLVARRVGAADAGLFASKDYLAKHGTPSTLADLASHEIIRFRQFGPHVVMQGPKGVEESFTLAGPIQADELLFVQRMAALGAGIAVLPIFFSSCAEAAARGGLVRILPEWALRGPVVHLVAPSARHEPRRVRLFREFLLARAKERGFGR